MSTFTAFSLLLFLLLGSLAGFVAGLLGIGGGIILVPLFLWVFTSTGFAPEIVVHSAFGTSLAIITLTATSSTFGHRKRGNVGWHQVGYLILGGIVGALLGAWWASMLSGDWLKGLFGVMQILVALKMVGFHPRMPPEENRPRPPAALLAIGLAGGTFSAFFGVGGGIVAVPLLVLALGLPIHLAVGNSSALIVVSSFFGAISYMYHGQHLPNLPPFSVGFVNLLVVLLVAPVTMLTARLGVRIASRTSHDRLLKVFATLLVLVGLRMIYRAWLA
ncbi:MAG: sulfite exporter TauE/SafE family protein [Desulfuromonadales bacterium]|nr:sulfite exporter TauE/SafE family protein [Desulfuromonadales bacterium]